MNADGTGTTQLTFNTNFEFDPAWSSDGKRIAFSSDQDGGHEVYVMNADGTAVTQLTFNTGFFDGNPEWSPDGKQIAFDSERTGDFEVYVMNADGTGVTQLTLNPATDGSPRWTGR